MDTENIGHLKFIAAIKNVGTVKRGSVKIDVEMPKGHGTVAPRCIMTRNERIAEKMGWTVDKGYCFDNYNNCVAALDDIGIVIDVAKLLQDRMVEDGWMISATFDKDTFGENVFIFRAIKDVEFIEWSDTEPAALVALFCKVYGITEEE
jgi:hypothetical protein